jgi:glycosyltransferase involved in cell wall biosynthesis
LFFKACLLLIRNNYGIVHAHEEAVFFCVFIKRIFGFKLIYDMHSSLPQQLTNFQFTTFKPLVRVFKHLEDKAIKRSDAIITICPDLSNYVNGVLLNNNQRHVLIENSIFDPVRLKLGNQDSMTDTGVVDNHQETISLWRNQACPIVVYAGTLEPYQGLDILIRAFEKVLQKIPAARLLVVGGSPNQVEKYSQIARALHIEEAVRFTGRVPQKTAQRFTQAAHVQVSPRSSGTNTPLKIYEQLANGIPLVATNIYSHTQAIDDHVAFLVEPDPSDMAQGIIQAITSKDLRERKTLAALTLYNKMYSRPVYERKLLSIVTSLAST